MDLEDMTLGELLTILDSNDITTLVELLLNNKQKWNKLIAENQRLKQDIKLKDIDIPQMDLSGIDLSGVKLDNVDLSGANLTGAKFSGAELNNINLANAVLDETKFDETIIGETNLSNVSIYNSNIDQAYITGANPFKSEISEYSTSEKNTRNGFHKAGSVYSKNVQSGKYLDHL